MILFQAIAKTKRLHANNTLNACEEYNVKSFTAIPLRQTEANVFNSAVEFLRLRIAKMDLCKAIETTRKVLAKLLDRSDRLPRWFKLES